MDSSSRCSMELILNSTAAASDTNNPPSCSSPDTFGTEKIHVSSTKPSFTRFRFLPYEIRLIIWNFALPGPRIVHLVRYPTTTCPLYEDRVQPDPPIGFCQLGSGCQHQMQKSEYTPGSERYALPILTTFRSDCPPPAMLNACRESYEVASKLYAPLFSSFGCIAETYINPAIDTLHLNTLSFKYMPHYVVEVVFCCANDNYLPKNLEMVENLSVDIGLYFKGRRKRVSSWIASILNRFPNLKKLTIVDDDYKSFLPPQNANILERDEFDRHTMRYERSSMSSLAREDQLRLVEGNLTEEERTKDLAFVDVVDIGNALASLNNVDDSEVHEHSTIDTTVSITDYSRLEALRLRTIRKNRRAWRIPVIEHKTLTTTKMKAELERSWREYEKSLNKCPCLMDIPHPSSAGAARWAELQRQHRLSS